MQTQNTQQTHNRQTGFSGDMAETAAGSELLESFFGAAIGIPIPSIGPLDAGHAIDAIDEIHADKQAGRQFELGQKSAITQDFNFGGTNYNSSVDQESEQTWQPKKPSLEQELAKVPSYVPFNPEMQQKTFPTP